METGDSITALSTAHPILFRSWIGLDWRWIGVGFDWFLLNGIGLNGIRLAGIGWDWLGLAGIGWDWLGLALFSIGFN